MTTSTSLREQAEFHASVAQWPQALACFEALLAQRPGDADVLLQLSYVSSLAGQYRQGRRYALAAAEAAPRVSEQVQELIARLRTFNEVPALRAYLKALGPAERLPTPLLLAFAAHLGSLNEEQAALDLLDVARQKDPASPSVLMLRGQSLLHLGRFDDAEADLLACARQVPMLARTWGLLASLGRQTAASNHVSAIREQMARPNRPAQDIAELGFALHRSLDDLGDYVGAWNALQVACKAKRGLLQYSSQESVELVDELVAARMPVPEQHAEARHRGMRLPIFIVGMHRSGTTLLEQLLHGHSDVQGLGELYDFTSSMRYATDHHCRGVIDQTLVQRASGVDFEAVGRHYLDGLCWRLGSKRAFIDKLPSNFFNVGFICRALPEARILHMRRDPMETCFSNLRELFADANPYSYDQRELGAFHLQYQRLMQHWHKTLPGRILDVDYAALVNDTEATIHQVTQFCDLAVDPTMLSRDRQSRSVSTASAVAVRQPIATRSAPRWAPYAAQLKPLKDALSTS